MERSSTDVSGIHSRSAGAQCVETSCSSGSASACSKHNCSIYIYISVIYQHRFIWHSPQERRRSVRRNIMQLRQRKRLQQTSLRYIHTYIHIAIVETRCSAPSFVTTRSAASLRRASSTPATKRGAGLPRCPAVAGLQFASPPSDPGPGPSSVGRFGVAG